MNLLILAWDGKAADYFRLLLPALYPPKDTEVKIKIAINGKHTVTDQEWEEADAIMYNRVPAWQIGAMTAARKKHGCILISDIDTYWEMPSTRPGYKEYTALNQRNECISAMKVADLVITSSSRLAERVMELGCKDIEVIPTAIPFGRDQFGPAERESSEKTRIIYSSPATNFADLDAISVALSRVYTSRWYLNMEFILANYVPKGDCSVRCYSTMSNSHCVRTIEPQHIANYAKIYDTADVVLAPMVDNLYNTFRDNRMLLDAGCKKMPLIAQKMYPYLDDESMDGIGMKLCNDVWDYIDAFKFFKENKNAITEYGEALHAYVNAKYNFDKINQERFDIIHSLCSTAQI